MGPVSSSSRLPLRSTSTFALRLAGRGLTLASAIVITRLLGAHQYGIYAYAIAWTTLLTVPTSIGADRLVIKYVAHYDAREQADHLKGIVAVAAGAVLLLSLVAALAAAGVALLAVDQTYLAALLLALPLIPIQGMVQILAAAVQGLHHPEWSLTPYFVVAPLFLCITIVAFHVAGIDTDASAAVVASIVSMAIALVAATALAVVFVRPRVSDATAVTRLSTWMRSLGPLALVAILTNCSAQIGVLTLGAKASATDVGGFQVALKTSALVTLILVAINTGLAPRVARLHSLEQVDEIRVAAQQASRVAFYVSLPIGLLMIVGRGLVLSVFGGGFASVAGSALVVLVTAEVFNAAVGSVAIVLIMTGRGGAVARAMVVGLFCDAVLCLALIPSLGGLGAAIARATDVVVWNAILTVYIWRRLGFNATAFAHRRPADPGSPSNGR